MNLPITIASFKTLQQTILDAVSEFTDGVLEGLFYLPTPSADPYFSRVYFGMTLITGTFIGLCFLSAIVFYMTSIIQDAKGKAYLNYFTVSIFTVSILLGISLSILPLAVDFSNGLSKYALELSFQNAGNTNTGAAAAVTVALVAVTAQFVSSAGAMTLILLGVIVIGITIFSVLHWVMYYSLGILWCILPITIPTLLHPKLKWIGTTCIMGIGIILGSKPLINLCFGLLADTSLTSGITELGKLAAVFLIMLVLIPSLAFVGIQQALKMSQSQ
jgi:hypothetical protein